MSRLGVVCVCWGRGQLEQPLDFQVARPSCKSRKAGKFTRDDVYRRYALKTADTLVFLPVLEGFVFICSRACLEIVKSENHEIVMFVKSFGGSAGRQNGGDALQIRRAANQRDRHPIAGAFSSLSSACGDIVLPLCLAGWQSGIQAVKCAEQQLMSFVFPRLTLQGPLDQHVGTEPACYTCTRYLSAAVAS